MASLPLRLHGQLHSLELLMAVTSQGFEVLGILLVAKL